MPSQHLDQATSGDKDHSKSLEHTDAFRATHESKQATPVFASAIESAF